MYNYFEIYIYHRIYFTYRCYFVILASEYTKFLILYYRMLITYTYTINIVMPLHNSVRLHGNMSLLMRVLCEENSLCR